MRCKLESLKVNQTEAARSLQIRGNKDEQTSILIYLKNPFTLKKACGKRLFQILTSKVHDRLQSLAHSLLIYYNS